ncbi:MAG: hypothetical protein AAFV53_34725, partial [Myxococcota bacterium]
RPRSRSTAARSGTPTTAPLIPPAVARTSILLLPTMFFMVWHSVIIAAVLATAGGISGAVVGVPLRAAVDRLRGRLPLWGYALVMPLFGAIWGTLALFGASVAVNGMVSPFLLWQAVLFGGPFGAVLVGVLWLPYAMASVLRGRRWPVALATGILSPVIAAMAWWAVAIL